MTNRVGETFKLLLGILGFYWMKYAFLENVKTKHVMMSVDSFDIVDSNT